MRRTAHVGRLEGHLCAAGAPGCAVELSATKYCSVGSTLASGITETRHAYRVTDTTTGVETAGEVVVLGPNLDPATPAAAG